MLTHRLSAGPVRAADVVLATGAVATVRPVRPEDSDAMRALYQRADPESLRLRFFSYSRHAAGRDVERMMRPATDDHIALVVTAQDAVIGMGCVERVGRGVGEIALLVDDTRHGQGVGMLLVEHLVAVARAAGFRTIRADVLADNAKMLKVFHDLGARTSTRQDFGVIDLEFPLVEREEWRRAVERREAFADYRSLARILAPHSVVVIGASRRAAAIGHRLVDSLVDGGFTGDLYAVNRSGEAIRDVQTLTRIADLPVAPDLAIIAVPAAEVPAVIADCAALGVRGAVIVSDGFAELGDDGKAAQRTILTTARTAGMRLIGPNCLGVVNADPEIKLNATFADLAPLPGRVGVASQSGGVGLAMLDHLSRHRIGVSTFVSLGNKADVSGNDLLMFWEQDSATETCMLYLESFGNARKFARIASRVARRKPIVAITAGQSSAGARGVRSHTAAAATPAVVLDALFAQAGVIRARSMGEAMDIVALLDRAPLPQGRRVAILTNGGGPGALAADACEAAGLALPELSPAIRAELGRSLPPHASTVNPVDTTAGGTVEVLASAARTLLTCSEVDAVMVVHTSLSRDDTTGLAGALRSVSAANPHKSLIAVYVGKSDTVTQGGPPRFDFPEPAAFALSAVASYAQWRATPPPKQPRLGRVRRRDADRVVATYLEAHPEGGWLDTDASVALAESYGIPVAPTMRAETADRAVELARKTGYPVVVKAAAGSVLHRTDRGAVRLGVRSDSAVREAVAAINESCGKTCAVVVQPTVSPGIETAVGIASDPSVGPIVMLALGGVATDLLADRSFRLPPIGRAQAREQIRDLRSSPLLFGYRGSPAADVRALEDVILRVGLLATEVPQITDLDLNPVVVNAEGAVAVDVKVRLVPPDRFVDPYLRRLSRA
jgi:acyl-CoA synthetase (NDP forming)/GNAT superfamily N-acetyltransferase